MARAGTVRAAHDDEFEVFVRGNRAWLVRFATTLTAGDAHLAEDLVQVALVHVYLAKPSRTRDLHSYVRRAVVNGLIDHERRPFRRRERSAPELPERAAVPSTDSVDPELIAALAALPVRMRAAIVLRHVEALSVEETARALRCSTGNVKSQTSRGLNKLRDLLTPGEPFTATAVASTGTVHSSPAHHTSATTDPRTSGAREGERTCQTP
jgi:RNA polymerase sigma factor (sigma-70 family)